MTRSQSNTAEAFRSAGAPAQSTNTGSSSGKAAGQGQRQDEPEDKPAKATTAPKPAEKRAGSEAVGDGKSKGGADAPGKPSRSAGVAKKKDPARDQAKDAPEAPSDRGPPPPLPKPIATFNL